jgi:hypothetical protein
MEVFYKTINPTINFGNKTQRSACEFLIKSFGLEEAINLTKLSCSVQGQQFAPVITTPYMLKEKLAQLKIYFDRKNDSNQTKGIRL